MRWVAILVLAAMPASGLGAAAPKWTMVAKDADMTAFIDIANVVPAGSIRTFSHKILFAVPMQNGWASIVSELRLDCQASTLVGLDSKIYDAGGKVVSEVAGGADDKPDVIDGSNKAQLNMRNLVC